MTYDCIIIGGGIAGLQAAIQLGRYERSVLVIDSGYGRSTLCRCYHNILGWPDGISGSELRHLGKKHAQKYGVQFIQDKVIKIKKQDHMFNVIREMDSVGLSGKRLLIATGLTDNLPEWSGLHECLGISVYVCPDCDGYEVKNKRTLVLGSGKTGAYMALTLSYWTNELIYINHELKAIPPHIQTKLEDKQITYFEQPIQHIITEKGGRFQGVKLQNGKHIYADRSFLAFGGNQVHSDLAKSIGVERLENKHIPVDSRTKMTNIPHVWSAGDVVAHSQLATIAMGEGCQAAIWIHKSLISE